MYQTTVAQGFVGVLIVIRPGLGVVHPAVFLILLGALLFALRQILSRVVAGTDPIATTVAYTALAASLSDDSLTICLAKANIVH